MASTIKVNNIQNQCGANIVNKCSTTITLGASGDTIQLACGATAAGFGSTGEVSWDTTKKTTGFTAVSGVGYFCDTTSAAFTVTLPATPSAGNVVAVSDYNGIAATNNITVGRNSSNINGAANDYIISKSNSSVQFIYVDATVGWQTVFTGNTSDTQNPFIAATGGTETTCGDYKIHTFTGPGTFTVSNAGSPSGSDTVDYLVVAGGGGGAHAYGGGGGAGGYRESSGAASGCYTASPLGSGVSALPVTATGYPITVGGGGAGGSSTCIPYQPVGNGTNGANSIFSTITSAGGGFGLAFGGPSSGGPGGSGGGGSGIGPGGSPTPNGQNPGGTGNTPPVSPPQGQNGGLGDHDAATKAIGGGGGGAGAAGTAAPIPGRNFAGTGGNGVTSCITGSPVARAGGGGGGQHPASSPSAPQPGGTGGGGAGGGVPGGAGTAGTTNTGGGGGGASGEGPTSGAGAAGGSGIVVIRYKYQ